MSVLLHHPLLAFLIWTVLAVAFGLVLGKVIHHADDTEQPPTFDDVPRWDDTEEICWDKRPSEWVL